MLCASHILLIICTNVHTCVNGRSSHRAGHQVVPLVGGLGGGLADERLDRERQDVPEQRLETGRPAICDQGTTTCLWMDPYVDQGRNWHVQTIDSVHKKGGEGGEDGGGGVLVPALWMLAWSLAVETASCTVVVRR